MRAPGLSVPSSAGRAPEADSRARARGFPPISRPHAGLLILGSMPSRESLRRRQYYAHPRNAFWPIVIELFGLEAGTYAERAAELAQKGVAVWDVLKTCYRSSSLDSDIDEGSMEVNDFPRFFRDHPGTGRVFFNGAKAESIYRRRVLPTLSDRDATRQLLRLPSTSPAHASLSLEQKKAAWAVLLEPGPH